MTNSGLDIRNVGMLDGLIREFERAASQMSHIDADVRVHLNSVRDNLQRQWDVILNRLHDAERRLSCAESALSACQAAAAATSTMGTCQSCVLEEQEVEMARMDVEKWRMRYDQGQQILIQCQQEISDYESGAHQLVERMCNEHAPQATRQLNSCIDMLQDILNSDLGEAYAKNADVSQSLAPKEKPEHTANDMRFDDFRKNIRDAGNNPVSGRTGDSLLQSQNKVSTRTQMHTMSHSGSLLRPARFK